MLESAKHRILTYYQGYEVTITEYVEHFRALVGIIECYRAAYGNKLGLIKAQLLEQGVSDINMPDADKLKKALVVCRDSYLSFMILQGSDNSSRFYQLKTELVNDMMKGQGNFPKTILKTTVFRTITRCRGGSNASRIGGELSFLANFFQYIPFFMIAIC